MGRNKPKKEESNHHAKAFKSNNFEAVAGLQQKSRLERAMEFVASKRHDHHNSVHTSDNGKSFSSSIGKPISTYLTKFLTQKRETLQVMPMEYAPLDDTYIKQFFESVQENDGTGKSKSKSEYKSEYKSESESESESENESDSVESGEVVIKNIKSKSNRPVDNIVKVSKRTLKILNLPYKATEKSVELFMSKHIQDINFDNINISMDIDKIKNLPAGSATVTIAIEEINCETNNPMSNLSVERIIEKLHAEDFDGRIVKVFELGSSRKMPTSNDSGRYFGVEVSTIKCHNCGGLDHRFQDCNEITATCYLCAGTDHDVTTCQQTICFRCGGFGHQSFNCQENRVFTSNINNKIGICTRCGSTSHIHYECTTPNESILSNIEGPYIRCMCCKSYGHTMCKKILHIPVNEIKSIYCPNCGGDDHHVDYPNLSKSGVVCKWPRMEAYSRFPNLLTRLLENSQEDFSSRVKLYNNLVERNRYKPEQEVYLFPCLRSKTHQMQYSHHGNNGNNSSLKRSREGCNFESETFHHKQQSRYVSYK